MSRLYEYVDLHTLHLEAVGMLHEKVYVYESKNTRAHAINHLKCLHVKYHLIRVHNASIEGVIYFHQPMDIFTAGVLIETAIGCATSVREVDQIQLQLAYLHSLPGKHMEVGRMSDGYPLFVTQQVYTTTWLDALVSQKERSRTC